MTLHMTPAIVEAAYELLLTTPPFRAWKLPHADDIEFHIDRHKSRLGAYRWEGKHTVAISSKLITQLPLLLSVLAHELCHLRQQIVWPRDKAEHGYRFNRMADAVCRWHSLDRAMF